MLAGAALLTGDQIGGAPHGLSDPCPGNSVDHLYVADGAWLALGWSNQRKKGPRNITPKRESSIKTSANESAARASPNTYVAKRCRLGFHRMGNRLLYR